MSDKRVDYDQLAPTYNQRFSSGHPSGVGLALSEFIRDHEPASILEVGCGTGHWLALLAPHSPRCLGLDRSKGMLQQAQNRSIPLSLIQGDAGSLPFPTAEFEMIFCVNAIHHFDQPQRFIAETHRILRSDGWLVVIGSDPHGNPDRWYGYQYFPGTYQTDLARFPGESRLVQWFASAGFQSFSRREVVRISEQLVGREVLADPYLQKQACSQLALLRDDEYNDGLVRIEQAIELAERCGNRIEFRTEITIFMWSGRKN